MKKRKLLYIIFILIISLCFTTSCKSKDEENQQVIQGPQGNPGVDGTSLLTGNGMPNVQIGINGDSYIDLDTWNYYVKTKDEWILKGNIQGTSKEDHDGTEGLEFYLLDDGTYAVSMGRAKFLSEIVFPSHYKGKKVTRIVSDKEGPFLSNISLNLKKVDIPETVTYIGDYTFINCKNLQSVELPTGLLYIGKGAFENCTSLTKIKIPDNITSIGDSTFFNCTSLTEIEIPNGVTSIGESTFDGCSSLASIIVPNNVTTIGFRAFRGCESLTSITLPFIGDALTETTKTHFGYVFGAYSFDENEKYVPNKLKDVIITESTNIGEYAFYECVSLLNIKIPNGIKSIGEYAFCGCDSLNYNVYDNAKYLGNELNPFLILKESTSNDITSCEIHQNTKFICEQAFFGCTNITNIAIPYGITDIFNGVFSGCSSLESIVIPDSVTNIGDNTFSHCTSLTEIKIPNGVTNLGSWAFSACESLTSIEIPDSVTRIGKSAFAYCSSLIYNIEEDAMYLGNQHNPYLVLAKAKNAYGENYKINENTKIILGEAFSECYGLTNITIPESVKSFGYNAFSYECRIWNVYYNGTIEDWCYIKFENNLANPMSAAAIFYMLDEKNEYYEVTEIKIPNTITSIGDYQFYQFPNVYKIIIPDSVISIGQYVFYNWADLKIYCEASSKPIGWADSWNSFSGVPVIWGYTIE